MMVDLLSLLCHQTWLAGKSPNSKFRFRKKGNQWKSLRNMVHGFRCPPSLITPEGDEATSFMDIFMGFFRPTYKSGAHQVGSRRKSEDFI